MVRWLGLLLVGLWLLGQAAPALGAGADEGESARIQELREMIAAQSRRMERQSVQIQDLELAVKDLRAAREDLPPVGSGDPDGDLEGRIGSLEQLVGRTHLGGWMDFIYFDKYKQSRGRSFDPHHFYLFVDNRLNEEWQAFGEIELEHAPEHEGTTVLGALKLERLYIQYSPGDLVRFRFGKFNTRVGYWTPVHWAINVDTIQKPIHEDNHYVPAKQVGIEAFGKAFLELRGTEAELSYAGWISNGEEISGTDSPSDDRLGGGADCSVRLGKLMTLGGSWYQQSESGGKENNRMLYADLELPRGVTLRGESLHQDRENGLSDLDVYYAKLKWQFREDMYVNYRLDYGDDVARGNGGKQIQHTATLGYWPFPQVRLKLEFVSHHFDDAAVQSYRQWQAWLGFVL